VAGIPLYLVRELLLHLRVGKSGGSCYVGEDRGGKKRERIDVTPRILQLNFFFSLLAKIRALPFPFLFPFAKP
jgi:hypothetical protein